MVYCGHYGCRCCTCEHCGTYHGCICGLKERTKEFLEGRDGKDMEPDEALETAYGLLAEWILQ